MLADILESDPDIEIAGTASDAIFGLRKAQKLDPDVITCDIEMPRMDGLTFLKRLMNQNPKPVVIISAYTRENCQTSLRALELGAVEVIEKPGGHGAGRMDEISDRIITAVKTAAHAKVRRIGRAPAARPRPVEKPAPSVPVVPRLPRERKHLIDELLPPAVYKPKGRPAQKVVAVGASTGGTVAIGAVLKELPPTLPGIVIVQHIPPGFTKPFAERLDSMCRIEVREARDGDRVKQGTALVAPGDSHMVLAANGNGYFVKMLDAFPINRHKPSVDVLFRSVAGVAGPHAIGVILTGMNDDGARAMLDMHNNGAYNIAQDEESCVVFGMPKNAIERGGVDVVAPLEKIPDIIIRKAGAG